MKRKSVNRKINTVSIIFFISFFLGICFVTTANTILFLQGSDLPEYYIRDRAPKVFIIVFVLFASRCAYTGGISCKSTIEICPCATIAILSLLLFLKKK